MTVKVVDNQELFILMMDDGDGSPNIWGVTDTQEKADEWVRQNKGKHEGYHNKYQWPSWRRSKFIDVKEGEVVKRTKLLTLRTGG